MKKLTAEKYRELFKLRAEGKLDDMECTKSLYKILQGLYFDGIKILDVGCSAGHYFRKIRELGDIDYLGIDIDSRAIEIAKDVWKESPNVRFDVQNIYNLNLQDNFFDIVYCYNLLLHLMDYKTALKELFRVSKRHIIIRSLFGLKENISLIDIYKDYMDMYPSGKIPYNKYARNDVGKFLKSLGFCKFRFIKDNLAIPKESIEKQRDCLDVDDSEFTNGHKKGKQIWKNLELNYEVLIIKKQ